MSKAAEYCRMLAGIYADPDRTWPDGDGTDNSDVIGWCNEAAEAVELIEWLKQQRLSVVYCWGTWSCLSHEADTPLGAIAKAKEAYEAQ